MWSPTQKQGQAAEQRASAYLQKQGLRELARNFRCPQGEIDLIMREGSTLVFVEVRQRAGASHGGAAESVTRSKQMRLIRTAERYLQDLRGVPIPACRFDVVAMESANIDWIRDAFQAF